MTTRPWLRRRLNQENARWDSAEARSNDGPSTPQQKLLRAAEQGKAEALVRKARPAEPVAMVTPQEREAELRAAGQWPSETQTPKPAPEPAAPVEPERELTPNEQYIAEHCHWRLRGPSDYARQHHEPGRCLVDYNPIDAFYAEQEELEEGEE
jgi:hypothetical protein